MTTPSTPDQPAPPCLNGHAPSTKIRHSGAYRCPICRGNEDASRGEGLRCFGFTSDDWVHCTREEHAGQAKYFVGSTSWAHLLRGRCPCGTEHVPADPLPAKVKRKKGVVDRAYQYRDLDGTVAHETVRYRDPKGFKQRRPDGEGGFVWSLKGIKTILYRRPELLAAAPGSIVIVVEGEKDVDRLYLCDQVATCNPMGAGKWDARYSEDLRGQHVIIFADNDPDGRAHAQLVARSLYGIAASVKVIELPGLPEKGDVSDFLDAGGTVDQLRAMADKTSEWVPSRDVMDKATAPNNDNQSNSATDVNEAVDDPHRLARSYLGQIRQHPDGLTQRFYRDEFWAWENSHYSPLPAKEVNAHLNGTCKTEFDRANRIAIKEWLARG